MIVLLGLSALAPAAGSAMAQEPGASTSGPTCPTDERFVDCMQHAAADAVTDTAETVARPVEDATAGWNPLIASAGDSIDMVALAAATCVADAGGAASGHSIYEAQRSNLSVDVAPAIGGVACANRAGRSSGVTYYVPRRWFGPNDSNLAKSGNYNHKREHYLRAFHCGGHNDDNCSHHLYYTTKSGTKMPEWDFYGGGRGYHGGRTYGVAARPYCKTSHFAHSVELSCYYLYGR